MKPNITFNIGEKRYVSIRVKSTSVTPFEVTNASWKLKCGDDIEASGLCVLEEESPTKWILRALVQPMRACASYKLVFEYDISPEHMSYIVNLITLRGGG